MESLQMAQQRELSETSIKGCLEPERLPGYILAPSCATPHPQIVQTLDSGDCPGRARFKETATTFGVLEG